MQLSRPLLPAATTTVMPAFQACSSLTQRIRGIALLDCAAERQIDNPDIVSGLDRYRAIDRADHGRVRALSVCIQNTKIDELCTGRDTFELHRAGPAARISTSAG